MDLVLLPQFIHPTIDFLRENIEDLRESIHLKLGSLISYLSQTPHYFVLSKSMKKTSNATSCINVHNSSLLLVGKLNSDMSARIRIQQKQQQTSIYYINIISIIFWSKRKQKKQKKQLPCKQKRKLLQFLPSWLTFKWFNCSLVDSAKCLKWHTWPSVDPWWKRLATIEGDWWRTQISSPSPEGQTISEVFWWIHEDFIEGKWGVCL